MVETAPLTVVYRPLAELVPYAANARTHSPEQVEQIAASMREFGWTSPILVDGARGIIAGHGRVMAAKLLGQVETRVPERQKLVPQQSRVPSRVQRQFVVRQHVGPALRRRQMRQLDARHLG